MKKIKKRNTNIVYWCMYMEFKKKVMMTLYVRQQKRHRCKEQSFGLCGRRQGWDDLREQHWNMYITICKKDDRCKFDAWSRALKAISLGNPRGMGWGRRKEIDSGCRGHMYICGWLMSMHGKNQHNIVKYWLSTKINKWKK